MTAYFVAIRERVNDEAALHAYSREVGEVLASHSAKRLAAYGKMRALEGDPADGAVIVAFPTFEAAEQFYDSPEYRKVMSLRLKGADYRTFILDGLPG